MTNTLDFLPFKKTFTFKTDILPSSNLVRTGTFNKNINENNSFFSLYNSIVHACSKKFVIETDESINTKDIIDFQQQVLTKFYKSKKFTDFYDNIAEQLISLSYDFYNFFTDPDFIISNNNKLKSLLNTLLTSDKDDDKSKIELYQIILEIIPIDSLQNKIIRSWRKKIISSNTIISIEQMKFLFMKELKRYLNFFDDLFDKINDKERINYIKIHIGLLFDHLFDIVVNDSQISIPNFSIQSIDDIISHITILQKTNIFFIDSVTHKISLYTNYYPEYKSIIILSFDNNKHFEIIGKKLENNRIIREFMPYEEITKALLFNKKSQK